jgi:predicted O-linked N-acetylglucosamine transferase (SPINDLY family)
MQVGLEELVATSAADYVERTVAAVINPGQLAEWRLNLRRRMRASTLMQPQRLTRQLEAAYFQMWRA